ncbi:MAG: hypothetical protein ACI9UK_001829 [Candidatus Krumholzibacteriia bacterium]|jgi:hypothetical protein
MTNLYRMITRARSLTVGLTVLCFLVLVQGCSKSTDPFGEDDTGIINFTPKSQGHTITLAEEIEFLVTAPDANILNVNWIRNQQIASNEFNYVYRPSSIGADTLRVQANADGINKSYFWVITVESEPSTSPPIVPGVIGGAGPAAGDVAVSWNKVGNTSFPMKEYVIALSHTGSITALNWDQAREIRRVAHRPAVVGYQENFTVADDGMVEGAEVWLAVRAVDELGQMSPMGNNGFTVTTTSWWLNGVVEDEAGVRHPGIVVESLSPSVSTNTELNGEFKLGPFRSIDEISLKTKSSNAPISGWFDFTTTPLDSTSSDNLRIVLITRHLIDEQCTNFGGQFLTLLKNMTRVNTEDPILRRWESFPLSYYIPERTNADGTDFGLAARFALAYWDSVLGGDNFVESTDQETAQFVFRFDDSANNLFGELTLLKPNGPGISVGDVVPEQMQVYVNDAISTNQFAKEITMHEIGHGLGLFEHLQCGTSTYIMSVSVGGSLSKPHPIHRDEVKMVQTIKALPQNTDLSKYFLN